MFAGTWQAASGAAAAELATLRWLRELFGLPEAAGGLFVDGGSSANLYGLVAARRAVLEDRLEGAVLYASDQTHSWIGRAAGLVGLQPSQVRPLASDHEFRLPPEVVADAVAADRAAGRRPFCVVATSGTTSTGSVDPLADLAALCRAEGLWFHVDGAFGAPAILTAEGRRLLAGIEQADSLALDAHKWLFQPLEAGCVLVRDVALLESIFSARREFLLDAAAGDREVNFTDRGLQLTRSFRAFKLWLSLKVFGLDAFAAAVQHGMDLAGYADALLLRRRTGWKVAAPTPARPGQLPVRRPRPVARGAGGGQPAARRRHAGRRAGHPQLDRPGRPHDPAPVHGQPPHDQGGRGGHPGQGRGAGRRR